MGKQTPSQFDFSNGLPECLRSNKQRPFINRHSKLPAGQQGSASKANDNSFTYFLARDSFSLVFSNDSSV